MKKKILVGLISCGAAAGALAQGTLIFENQASYGNIYLGNGPNGYALAGTYTVALLWASGNTLGIPQSAFTRIALYGLATGGPTQSGYFYDPNTVTTPTATAPGSVAVFEVQAWLGSYTSYAAAVAAGSVVGQSVEFLNATGNPNPPPTAPVNTTGWDGNIYIVPEPSSFGLAALGAAGIWFFRRRKQKY